MRNRSAPHRRPNRQSHTALDSSPRRQRPPKPGPAPRPISHPALLATALALALMAWPMMLADNLLLKLHLPVSPAAMGPWLLPLLVAAVGIWLSAVASRYR